MEDKEKLVTERHRFNLESVDKKMKQKEFVVASPQQQQVIASFTASSTKRHLVLEGPAGTGKTLVASQVANNLLESLADAGKEAGNEPLLVVTAFYRQVDDPIMKYLDASTGRRANKIFKSWMDILEESGVSQSKKKLELLHLTEALAKRWERRQIVMLVDEIRSKNMLRKLEDQSFPDSVRMILVVNPSSVGKPFTLPPSFLQVTLTTPYRSTIAITSLARFVAKCKGLVVPEGDFGSDVEGTKPIFFDVGNDERKMEEALEHCHKHLGDKATILYGENLPSSMKKVAKKQGKEAGGPWECYKAFNFYGWEAERMVTVAYGTGIMELITRARTHLCVILTGEVDSDDCEYVKHKEHFQQAADLGLIEMVQLSREAVENNQACLDVEVDADVDVEANDKTAEEVYDDTGDVLVEEADD